jgi:hypothetical protein
MHTGRNGHTKTKGVSCTRWWWCFSETRHMFHVTRTCTVYQFPFSSDVRSFSISPPCSKRHTHDTSIHRYSSSASSWSFKKEKSALAPKHAPEHNKTWSSEKWNTHKSPQKKGCFAHVILSVYSRNTAAATLWALLAWCQAVSSTLCTNNRQTCQHQGTAVLHVTCFTTSKARLGSLT